MLLTDTFDPQPDVNYGKCRDCVTILDTKGDADKHMSETCKQSNTGRGHTVSITNPTRKDRIERGLTDIIDEHLQKAYEEIDELIEDGRLTKEEVDQSYALSYDIETGWEEYLEENS